MNSPGHGSTRILTDLAGSIANLAAPQIFHYTAYGNAINFTMSGAATQYLYSGEQFDSRVGQQYLRARYYNQANGTFDRLDPFFGNKTDPQSFHKYLYTHGDPLNGVDPTGLFTLAALGISASAGGNARLNNLAAQINMQTRLSRALRAFGQVYGKLDKAWDWINAARKAIDLFQFDPRDIYRMGTTLKNKLFGGADIGTLAGAASLPLVKTSFAFPKSIYRKLTSILGPFKGTLENNNAAQEWIGSLGATLVAKALGFESTKIRVGYTGIDAVLYHPGLDQYLILEAKGGSGRLKGDQMRDSWIKPRLRKLAQQFGKDDPRFLSHVTSRRNMLAMVVKVQLSSQRQNISVGIQSYPGTKNWGTPFK